MLDLYFRLLGVFSDVVTYVLSALKENTSFVWEIAVHLMSVVVSFYPVLFLAGCLGWDLGLN